MTASEDPGDARRRGAPPLEMLGLPQPPGAGLGAAYLGGGRTAFRVWAPRAKTVELVLGDDGARILRLDAEARGYHAGEFGDVPPGTLYRFRLPARGDFADPASRHQPRGVHGPAAVLAPDFDWRDAGWFGLPIEEFVHYELHVGTFTAEGTFDAVIPHLGGLRELGITAIELMPVAEFPGSRNWGYDGVFPYAAQSTYGGPEALKRLVDACHVNGMAVVLDVVYNHLGPEGNYLGEFGHYFTSRYRTPWGDAVNFDGEHADEVRRFFIENALHWIADFHVDALRLDAVHAIVDTSAYPFLEELAAVVHERARHLNRQVHLIAESDRNDPRLVQPRELGGLGLDAQWSDDFHHALHTLLTGESAGYYADYGSIDSMARAFRDGFVYSGQYSTFRKRRHGRLPDAGLPGHRIVICGQNHDQVGNRMLGDRLAALVSFEHLKLAAGAVLLAPAVPLLFMGEEYGETAPFPYFVSHTDPDLVEAVRRGRRAEFAAFDWAGEPPDPQDEAVFLSARLRRELARRPPNRELRALYRELLAIRREVPALGRLDPDQQEIGTRGDHVLVSRRWHGISHSLALFNFGPREAEVEVALPEGRWTLRLDSAAPEWAGPGSPVPDTIGTGRDTASLALAPRAFALFIRVEEP